MRFSLSIVATFVAAVLAAPAQQSDCDVSNVALSLPSGLSIPKGVKPKYIALGYGTQVRNNLVFLLFYADLIFRIILALRQELMLQPEPLQSSSISAVYPNPTHKHSARSSRMHTNWDRGGNSSKTFSSLTHVSVGTITLFPRTEVARRSSILLKADVDT
jgi:hypothetical protein